VNGTNKDSQLARQRLLSLIRQTPGESFASLSRFLGRNHAYIQQHIRRGQPQFLSPSDRRKIAARLGVDADFLRPGNAAPDFGFREAADEIVFVPLIRGGSETDDFRALPEAAGSDSLPFRMSVLQSLGIDSSESVIACLAHGDSMMPTIGDGDLLLVDRTVRSAPGDGLYLIRGYGSEGLIKRVSLNPVTGRLTMRSDNPLYPVWQDCPTESVTILGRIIWQGRRL